jgi:hypothetical protein
MKLGPLQCLTNAPEEYDYGWQKTLVRNVATDSRGRSWRLCQNDDAWHLEQQVMRYGSGMYQGITTQAQLDEWLEGDNPLLTLTDNPVPVIRLQVNLRPVLEAARKLTGYGEAREEIVETLEVELPGVTVDVQDGGYLRIFTCEGTEAAQALRQHLKDLPVEPHGPQPDTSE